MIVTSEGKDGVVAHFVEDLVLEGTLEARGKHAMLEKVRKAPALIKVQSVVQAEPLGLGHAVGCVESVLDDDEDAVAVLLPDDLVWPRGVLETMAKVRAKRGGSVLCAIEVPRTRSAPTVRSMSRSCPTPRTRMFCASREWSRSQRPRKHPRTTRRRPLPAGSRDFRRAQADPARGGGELQLTDAIALLIDEGHPVHVVVHRGSRHDLGNPGGYLKAAVDFALDRDDYGPGLREWLVERLGRESSVLPESE